MKNRKVILMTAAFALASTGIQSSSSIASPNVNDLVVHEWGTFTSVQGSNGVVIEGLQHEDETLPAFVHGRDPLNEHPPTPSPYPRPERPCRGFKCLEFTPVVGTPLTVTQKMETPVIYFHTKQPQHVDIEVGFPKGIISQYYPKPVDFSPAIGSVSSLSGGQVNFSVDLVNGILPIPPVSQENIYSASRTATANYLRSGQENEKLIFYRGVGNFSTTLSATSTLGSLTLKNAGVENYPAAFLVNVTATGGSIRSLGQIKGLDELKLSSFSLDRFREYESPMNEFLDHSEKILTESLAKTGLYFDEAHAMALTWKKSYFKTPGLRILYVLSREETERLLPMKVTPNPQELRRTLVGRVEVMLDTEERSLLQRIQSGSLSAATELGRFAEPKLRRLLQINSDPAVRMTIEKLITQLK